MLRPLRSGIQQTLFVSLFALVCLFIGTSCATPPSKDKKPYEQCMCGPLRNLDQKPHCAIWAPGSRTDKPQPAWKAFEQNTCLPSDCSKLFSDFCEKIQMAPTTPPAEEGSFQQPCYCDNVLIEAEKGQVQNYCAAWAEGAPHVMEYYTVENCGPQRCAEAPFVKAPRLCKQGFRSFYKPLQNKRN